MPGPEAIVVDHVGMSVPDLDQAIAWYVDTFDFAVLNGPMDVEAIPPARASTHDLFGNQCNSFRRAHLVAANGVGLELFQFQDPQNQPPDDNFAYWRTGIFHLSLRVDDVAITAARIEANGGRQRSRVHRISADSHFCYCQDPFGIIIELLDGPAPTAEPSSDPPTS